MLGLAMALVHDPEILIIDELSLGLAPIVVEMLLEVVADLKRRGMTLIIVEQSINIALALADRALFMEKGQIRFSGQAADLLARDDLVRAVFWEQSDSDRIAARGLPTANGRHGWSHRCDLRGHGCRHRPHLPILEGDQLRHGGDGRSRCCRSEPHGHQLAVSYWVSFVACVLIGAAVGAAIELTVVRRLFSAPRVVLMIATIGVAELLLYFQGILPIPTMVTGYPTPIESSWQIGSVVIQGQEILVLVVVALLYAALWLFLGHTKYGLAIGASAANPNAARLAGINVRLTSTLVWTVAGTLTTIATILSAPLVTTTSTEPSLGPTLLIRALAAARSRGWCRFPSLWCPGLGSAWGKHSSISTGRTSKACSTWSFWVSSSSR